MLAQTSQMLVIVLTAILLPAAFSFPYSIYGLKNYQRSSRASGSNSPFSAPRQLYERSAYHSPSVSAPSSPSSPSSYYSNYDSAYDSDADSYYVDDEVDERPEREYLYGKPTYHGEYKPTRYYYARAPSYNYNNGHADSTNPLDDLHEEMLQEEQHERQRSFPAGQTQWFQNTGQPKSLTNNFMKNLILHNNGINVEPQPIDTNVNDAYEDDDVESPYFNDLTNQDAQYDYYDPLKFQSHQFNQYDPLPATKPKQNDRYTSSKNRKQNDYEDDSHEDKEEKDLESLRKNSKSTWNKNAHDKHSNNGRNDAEKTKHDDNGYNGGYDSGFNYDEDEWINWDRKRSLPKKQNENLRPLKALEFQLTKALQKQSAASNLLTTTVPPPTTSTVGQKKTYEHKGQKEVVLSRPATPLRRHFSDSVLDALTKTTNESQQSKQADTNTSQNKNTKDVEKQQQHQTHSTGTKKQKRFVLSETSLAQQLNDLKQKIKA